MVEVYVGAGGKTSSIFKKAALCRAEGKRVLVTTTTHMLARTDTIIGDDPAPILRALREEGFAMAGSDAGNGKICALSREAYFAACAEADVVLVEADGSKCLPLKFPAAHEPVIPENADEIVIVTGLSAIGQPIQNACHRPELVCACLGVEADTRITAAHVQRLIEEGYKKPLAEKYPHVRIRVHACQRDTMYFRAVAALLEAGEDVGQLHPQWFTAEPKMIICGAGHVGTALAHVALMAGFAVTVLDDRAAQAKQERFPAGCRVICAPYDALDSLMEDDAYYAVMTHGHRDDERCVEKILRRGGFAYAGMIGSKRKVASTLENLRSGGIDESQIERLHAPIGLAIGAVTPAEIAISVIAEIIAERRKRSDSSVSGVLLESREAGVLCVITKKEGSTPRGVGSMMLVTKNGVMDSIGGGAIEMQALRDAGKAGSVERHNYVLNMDEGALGMKCGGRAEVLMIPLAGENT